MASFKVKATFDYHKLRNAVEKTPDYFDRGAKRGIKLALKDMRDDARKIAPKRTGNLRAGIIPDSRITGSSRKGWFKGTLRSHAWNKGFDYAYFHNVSFPVRKRRKFYKKPTTGGTYPNYLQRIVNNRSLQSKYWKSVREETFKELRKAGWGS